MVKLQQNLRQKHILSEQQFRRLTMVLALFAIVGVLVLSYLAWQSVRYPDDLANIPLITADKSPYKIKPEDRGGMEVAHADRVIFDTLLEDGQAEDNPHRAALSPDPEAPIRAADIEAHARPAPDTSDADTVEEVIETVLQEDAGQGENTAEKLPVPTPPAAVAEASTPAAAPSTAEAAPQGKVMIQLGSFRSKDQAAREWITIQQMDKGILSNMRPAVEKADLGTRGVYFRLKTGPYASKAAAKQICNELAALKLPCIVAP